MDNINAAEFVKPTVVGPWSLFQRLSGVRRTPGPGTYHIDAGVFHPKQLYDPLTKQLRPMTNVELVMGGRLHDAALEAIGWGIVTIPVAGYWSYNQIHGNGGQK